MTNPFRAGEIMQMPGRLCINPTNLNGTYPFSGDDLGVVKGLIALPHHLVYKITAEEFNETVDGVFAGEGWTVGAILRNYDVKGLAKLFPNTSVGTSGKIVISHTSSDSNRAGHLLSSRSIKLLFYPDAPDRDPAFIAYKALPLLDESAQFNFAANTELALACMFLAVRDSSNKVINMGIFSDIKGL